MKKSLSIIISLLIIVSIIPSNVSAVSLSSSSISKIAKITSNSYISLSDAELLAKYTICIQAENDSECPWNNNTTIGQITPLYDLDNNINSYVFNLLNSNKNVGYMIINCSVNKPGVEMFTYFGLFDSSAYINKSDNNKIYHMYTLDLYIENKNEFYDIKSNKKINVSRDTLKTEYKNYMNIKNDNFKMLLNNLKLNKFNISARINSDINTFNSLATTSTQVIYEKHDVPYYNRAHFYTCSETLSFCNKGNNCSPTAGLTIVTYWARLRGKPNLINQNIPHSYNCIYYDMGTDPNTEWWGFSGTSDSGTFNGLMNYAKWSGCAVTDGCLYEDGSPSFSLTQLLISKGDPLMFNLSGNSKYGYHTLCVFGTERDNDGNWLRVADGWDSEYTTNYQMWYRYEFMNPTSIVWLTWK